MAAGARRVAGGKGTVHDSFVAEMGSVYHQLLSKLNSGLATILRRSRGMEKSEALLVWADAGDVIMKAEAAPKTSGGASKPAKLPGQKADREDTKKPGSRGGHWYRDAKGHIRYGTKPTSRYHAQVTDEEAEHLYSRIETVAGYDDKLDQALADASGWETEDLAALFQTARLAGYSPHDFYISLAEGDEEFTPDDAEKAWNDLMGAYQGALENPDTVKLAKEVISKRKRDDVLTADLLQTNEGLVKGTEGEFLTGNKESVAIKTLGALHQLGAIFLPRNKRDLAPGASKKEVGFIHTADETLDRIKGHLSDVSPAQQMNWAVAMRLRDVVNAADKDEEAEVALKDPDGNFSTQMPGKIEDILYPALEKQRGSKLSEAEKDQVAKRVNEIGAEINDLVHAYNHNTGGDAIGMLFREEITPKELFKDKDVLADVKQRINDKKDLIAASLAARENAEFEISPQMEKGFEAITADLRASGALKDPKAKAGLFDYQKKMVNWMLTVKRGLLAADTGTGKTPMLIAAMSNLLDSKKIKRGVLVLPKSLVLQWPNEIQKFRPGAKVVTLGEGMTMEDRLDTLEALKSGELAADFVIMSASTIDLSDESKQKLKDQEILEFNEKTKAWKKKKGLSDEDYEAALGNVANEDKLVTALKDLEGAVVFDEAHHESQGLKERKNIHHQVAKAMNAGREYTWLATATPMPNGRPEEMFNLMNLAHPGSAGESEAKFTNLVANYDWVLNEETGKMEEKLMAVDDWRQMSSDIKPFVYAKDKTDPDVVESATKMGQGLKDAHHREDILAMPKEVSDLYAKAGTLVPHDAGPEYQPFDEMNQFGQRFRILDQMQKIAITPKLILGDSYKGAQPKIEHATDLILKHFDSKGNESKPVVLFSQFPSGFKYLKEELIKRGVDPSLIGEIHSDVKQSDRDVVQEAVNAGKMKICLVGVKAGGAGLNLQKAANKVIFLDKPWSPAHVDQAVGRVHRTGQKETVDVVHMKLQGALDEQKLAKLRKKILTTKAATNADLGDDYLQKTTTASLIKLLGSEGRDNEVHLPESEIATRLEKLGLKGVIAPAALKGKFNVESFDKTVEYKRWKDQGLATISQAKTLNEVRFKKKKIDKATYEERKAKVGKQLLAWKAMAEATGKEKVAEPKKNESTMPEREFVPTETGGAGLEAGTLEHAIVQAMASNKVRTPTDLVDKVLVPAMEKEGASPEELDEMKPRLKAMAKRKMGDLERLGHIAPRTGHGADEEAKLPKPKTQLKPEKGEKPKKQKPIKDENEAPKKPKKVNVLKDRLVIGAKTHPKIKGDEAAVWKEWLKYKPKDFEDAMQKLGEGDRSLRPVLKEMVEKFVELGLLT